MAVISSNAEGGGDGSQVSVAGPAGGSAANCITTSNNAKITYSKAVSAHGTTSYRFDAGSAGKAILSFKTGSTSQLAGRFYLRFDDLPKETVALAQATNMAGQNVQIIMSRSGELLVRDIEGKTLYTSSNRLGAKKWYRIELVVGSGSTEANGTVKFAVYDHDSTTAINSYSASNVNAGQTAFSYFSVGKLSNGSWSAPFYVDDITTARGSSSFIGPVKNAPPKANAGADRTAIAAGVTVTLTGTGSDTDGTVTEHIWRQVTGPAVELRGTGNTRVYTAPATVSGATLIFGYRVKDNEGALSTEDTVKHVVFSAQQRAPIDEGEVPLTPAPVVPVVPGVPVTPGVPAPNIPVPPISTPGTRGPLRMANLAEARTKLRLPSDANYVMWNPSWPADRDLEDVFASLGANDILVLPERPQPYLIDTSEGFRAAGVRSVSGRYGQLPIVSKYKGGRDARTWFGMARARRGVVGLGPNARIEMSASSWRQEPQVEDKGSVQDDGWRSTGRYWTDTSGRVRSELVGCQEKVLEAAHSSPYFGNFTMRCRDLGGVAYIGISGKGNAVFERLDLTSAWRGFLGVPNGEAGAIAAESGTYFISKCILGTRDGSGKRVGSSPIMVNSSRGGRIEDTDASETRAGMLTIWNSSGKHTLVNVNTRFNWGPGLNLEKCQAGFQLEWIGGSNWADYRGRGGKTPKPSDQGTKGGMHVGLYAAGGSAKITFVGVDFDTGPTPGAVCIQTYGGNLQKASDIRRLDANGNSLPVKVY